MAHKETSFELHGVKLRMFRGGQGDPVLFLHGAAGLSTWTPFFEALSQNHDLIVPEHPGWGKSDDPAWLRTMDDLAMFYIDLIERIGLESFHLIGNSLGGWLAAEIAIRNPGCLKSLTVIAPAGLRPDAAEVPDMFAWSAEELTRNLFHDPAIVDRLLSMPVTEEMRLMQEKNLRSTAKMGRSTGSRNPALQRWLHRITAPVLVVWGDDDKVIPASLADFWKQQLPAAEIAIVRDCGHLPHAEKPSMVAQRVGEFLQKMQ